MTARYAVMPTILGYSAFTVGLCLILQPALRDVAPRPSSAGWWGCCGGSSAGRPAAGDPAHPRRLHGVGPQRAGGRAGPHRPRPARHGRRVGRLPPGGRPTMAVLELAGGQAVSGASRLVAGVVQLALLAFGIVAGIEAVGVPFAVMMRGSGEQLGAWAPWVGVLVFAIGVVVSNSAPGRSFPTLLIVLYVAWAGQVAGNALLGGSLSAFVGALVMTPVATWVSRLPQRSPSRGSCPASGCWSPVPSASSGSPRLQGTLAALACRARRHRRLDLRRRSRGALWHLAPRLGDGHRAGHRRAVRVRRGPFAMVPATVGRPAAAPLAWTPRSSSLRQAS